MMTDEIDIKGKAPWPSGALSNFAANAFVLDGIAFASMEGFLQGLKIADAAEQTRVFTLSGDAAQTAGRAHDWRVTGNLWWRGEPIDRLSEDYQRLLDRAYQALYDHNKKFRDALEATGDAVLTHKVGKDDPTETVLTVDELISRLERLRSTGKTHVPT